MPVEHLFIELLPVELCGRAAIGSSGCRARSRAAVETAFAPGEDDIRRTVLTAAPLTVTAQTLTTQTAAIDRVVPGATAGTVPSVQLSFRVDEAIAGVESGQVLTIHEWAGAWFMRRPMRTGQHVLIFLYPPSRLGLTSPVGGMLGQVTLDQTGRHAAEQGQKPVAPMANGSVSVVQLERAIRSAREE